MRGKFRDYDIILTTYETLRTDFMTNKNLFAEEWYRLVLDEGQYAALFHMHRIDEKWQRTMFETGHRKCSRQQAHSCPYIDNT